MYRIEYDENESLLRLKLTGFWDADIVARFSAELLSKTAELSRTNRKLSVLSDGTEFPVQPPEVAAGFVSLMNKISPLVGGRMAIVASGMLNKMQAQRIFTDPKIGVFATADEARAWLDGAK